MTRPRHAKRLIATGVAIAALIALALPTASLGAAHFYSRPAEEDAELIMHGTNGFKFLALTFGKSAIVAGSKQTSHLSGENVAYFALPLHPVFADDILRLKIGKLGRFRGRFIAKSSKTHEPFKGCTGDPSTVEKGFFVGSFNFHGERGYSTVHGRREPGTVTHQGATRCRVPAEGTGHGSRRFAAEEQGSREKEVSLFAGDRKGRLIFQARRELQLGPEAASTDSFIVSDSGMAGAFSVSRSAFVFGLDESEPTFQVPNLAGPPTEAIVEPPAPFSGSATFLLTTPKTASWSGDLAVELPGIGKVPLTGKSIQAGLCVPAAHCTKTLPERLQQLLEGSQDGSSYGTVEFQTIR